MAVDRKPVGAGQMLRAARLISRLSQRELAEQAGLPASTLARIESGETADPRLSTLERLLDAAGCELRAATREGYELKRHHEEHSTDNIGRHVPAHLDMRNLNEPYDLSSFQWGGWARRAAWQPGARLPHQTFTRARDSLFNPPFDPTSGVRMAAGNWTGPTLENVTSVGVLALQGDVREHLRILGECGVDARPVRRPSELDGLDGLVLPGGESTTIAKLARTFDVFEPIVDLIKRGLPVYGSCAGMILLADRVEGAMQGQETFGGIDITVRRNAFGRQVESFEEDLAIDGVGDVRGVFIRAPWVESVGPSATALGATAAGQVVAVRQGNLLATSFHPELTGHLAVHQYFCDLVRASQ